MMIIVKILVLVFSSWVIVKIGVLVFLKWVTVKISVLVFLRWVAVKILKMSDCQNLVTCVPKMIIVKFLVLVFSRWVIVFDSKMKKIIQKLQNLQSAGNTSLDNICQIYLQLLIFWIVLHFLQENIKKKLRGNCSNIRNLQGVNGSRPNIRKSFFLIWTPKKNKWNSSKFSDCQKHFICILPNLKNARVFSKLNVQEACGISAWMSNQIFLLQWSHHMDAVAGLASLLF